MKIKSMEFKIFNLNSCIEAGIAAAGFVTTAHIQTQANQSVMKGREIMNLTQTGTGRTAAFALPDNPVVDIHFIGRTCRESRSDDAFTLITSDDNQMVNAIDRLISSKIERRTFVDFDYGAPDAQQHMRVFARHRRVGHPGFPISLKHRFLSGSRLISNSIHP